MFKLRINWQQTCQTCGTQLVVDFLDDWPAQCSCPWCGAVASVHVHDGDPEARERLLAAVIELESRINAEFPV